MGWKTLPLESWRLHGMHGRLDPCQFWRIYVAFFEFCVCLCLSISQICVWGTGSGENRRKVGRRKLPEYAPICVSRLLILSHPVPISAPLHLSQWNLSPEAFLAAPNQYLCSIRYLLTSKRCRLNKRIALEMGILPLETFNTRQNIWGLLLHGQALWLCDGAFHSVYY